MNAPWELAQSLQRPPGAGALKIVAADTKLDTGMPSKEKVVKALHKIAHGMGLRSKIDGPIVLLLPPLDS